MVYLIEYMKAGKVTAAVAPKAEYSTFIKYIETQGHTVLTYRQMTSAQALAEKNRINQS